MVQKVNMYLAVPSTWGCTVSLPHCWSTLPYWPQDYMEQSAPDLHYGIMASGIHDLDPGIILCMHPANERWCQNVMLYLIGWAHAQSDPFGSLYRQLGSIWEVLWQKQVSRARTCNYIPQYLWGVITCPCPWTPLLTQHSLHILPFPVFEYNLWICLFYIYKWRTQPYGPPGSPFTSKV